MIKTCICLSLKYVKSVRICLTLNQSINSSCSTHPSMISIQECWNLIPRIPQLVRPLLKLVCVRCVKLSWHGIVNIDVRWKILFLFAPVLKLQGWIWHFLYAKHALPGYNLFPYSRKCSIVNGLSILFNSHKENQLILPLKHSVDTIIPFLLHQL